MSESKVYRSIGLMSGTSLDGHIDVALIETDGHDYVKPLDFYFHPYEIAARDAVRTCFGKHEADEQTEAAEQWVTDIHIEAVKESGFEAELVGFHGQTITHDPENHFTWQIGDGERMAKELSLPVVNDFRTADVKAGGQGAPLAPLYHQAIMAKQDKPVCVLNLGGVANVTYVGKDGLVAFDCGPANSLMDDYMRNRLSRDYDENGEIAACGQADRDVVESFLSHPYFKQKPPKSLDRNEFKVMLEAMPRNPEDAMATLAMLTAVGVTAAAEHFPEKPKTWFVSGGGAKNGFIMQLLADMLQPAKVTDIKQAGYNGDAIEAECFAYLAVRSKLGLALSLPSTTGVAEPQTGGVLHAAG